MSDTAADVAIVGGGPAGLCAALWLARALHETVVIDSGDPRNWATRGIHGYLGLHGIRPAKLRKRGRDECRQYGVTFIDAVVASVERVDDDRFTVSLESGLAVVATRLLLAIGIRDTWPAIPGLEQCYGTTAHVCPDCDGYEAREKKTVVIGSNRKAVGLALALTTWTDQIVICSNGVTVHMTDEELRKLHVLNIPVLHPRVIRAQSVGGVLQCLELDDGMTVDCERLFFAIGQAPADDIGGILGCARDNIGRIVTDERYHTSVRNVFAAGDIVHGSQLAIAAAASGAIAALAIHHSLLPESRKLADA